jgi:hypothetical protein
METRQALFSDLLAITRVYYAAKKVVVASGRKDPFKKNEPSVTWIEKHIKDKSLFVIADEKEVYGAFVLSNEGEGFSSLEGDWINSSAFLSISKIASDGRKSGLFNNYILKFAISRCPHLRIDISPEDEIMKRHLTANGFVYRGKITLNNGQPRDAYERV